MSVLWSVLAVIGMVLLFLLKGVGILLLVVLVLGLLLMFCPFCADVQWAEGIFQVKAGALGITFPVFRYPAPEKPEKKKKEKKEFVWKMPEKMTGIKDFDTYLLTCDTLWNRITTYRDSIHFFKIDTVLVYDKTDNTPYYDIQIRDEEGTKRSWVQSLQQGADMILSGTNIVLDVANISLLTVSAGASLTENPLLAFSHGKYLKAGPTKVR